MQLLLCVFVLEKIEDRRGLRLAHVALKAQIYNYRDGICKNASAFELCVQCEFEIIHQKSRPYSHQNL